MPWGRPPQHQNGTAIDPAIVAGFAAPAALPNGLTPEEISIMTALTAQLAAVA